MASSGRVPYHTLVFRRTRGRYGCDLRIQIWHLGQEELPPHTAPLFSKFAVETRDFYDYTDTVASIESNVGFRRFQLKPYALLLELVKLCEPYALLFTDKLGCLH